MQNTEWYTSRLEELTWEEIDKDDQLMRQLRALFFFFFEILMEGPNSEREITGCSFSQRGTNTLLVIKGVHEGIPQVGYVTAKYPIDCVTVAGRLILQGQLKWHLDKFAQT